MASLLDTLDFNADNSGDDVARVYFRLAAAEIRRLRKELLVFHRHRLELSDSDSGKQIRAILRRYKITPLSEPFSRLPKYVVTSHGERQGDPGSHRDAQTLREDLTLRDLIAFGLDPAAVAAGGAA